MPLLAQLVVEYVADVSKLTSGVQAAAKAQDDMKSKAEGGAAALRNLAAGAAVLAGTALIGIGVASTKMAADFQQGMTTLVTGAGEAESNMKMVGDGMLKMATDTGTTTKSLTEGMFMIESAGYRGADGLTVLKDAAEGAKVGNAALKDVANGVTTAMTDYNIPVSRAAEVTNDLIATVKNGKTSMGSLSNSLKDVLPVASSAGISLNGVSAAMATMTGQGVPAGQAATYLKTMIMALEAPSSKGASTLASIGLSAQKVSSEMKDSLPGALTMITDHLKKKFPEGSAAYTAALKDITGGSSALSAVLDLTGDHMSTFKGNVDNIYNSVKSGGTSIDGWTKVQGDFNFQMDKGREVVETMGIKLGTALLPKVGELLAKIMPSVTAFGNWLISSHALENAFTMLGGAITGIITVVSTVVTFFQQNHAAMQALQVILPIVAGAIAGLLVWAFWQWAVAATAAAIATLAAAWPFILIGAIIAAVVVGIILAIQHWGQIMAWLQGVWSAFTGWFMGLLGAIGAWFVGLWSGLAAWFTGMWTGIIVGLQAAWAFIINVIKIGAMVALAVLFLPIVLMAAAFIWLYQHNRYFKMLVDAIIGFFVGCFNWLRQAWTDVSNWLVGAWGAVVGFAANLWAQVSGAIKIGFSAAIGFVSWVWGVISSFFVNAWNNYIAKPLTAVWTTVSNFFSNIWNNYIAGPIGGLWNSISTTIGGWASSALTWGENLIQSFIDGIRNKIGEIGGALADTAKKIADFLGFHSPTRLGPGAEADQWAPNFVNMYAKGLLNGVPQIQDAVSNLVKPVAIGVKGTSNTPSRAPLQGGNQEIHVHNYHYLDGRDITDNVMTHVQKELRGHGLKK